MKLKQRKNLKKRPQVFDVAKLKQPEIKDAFSTEVSNRFAVLEFRGRHCSSI